MRKLEGPPHPHVLAGGSKGAKELGVFYFIYIFIEGAKELSEGAKEYQESLQHMAVLDIDVNPYLVVVIGGLRV